MKCCHNFAPGKLNERKGENGKRKTFGFGNHAGMGSHEHGTRHDSRPGEREDDPDAGGGGEHRCRGKDKATAL